MKQGAMLCNFEQVAPDERFSNHLHEIGVRRVFPAINEVSGIPPRALLLKLRGSIG